MNTCVLQQLLRLRFLNRARTVMSNDPRHVDSTGNYTSQGLKILGEDYARQGTPPDLDRSGLTYQEKEQVRTSYDNATTGKTS